MTYDGIRKIRFLNSTVCTPDGTPVSDSTEEVILLDIPPDRLRDFCGTCPANPATGARYFIHNNNML